MLVAEALPDEADCPDCGAHESGTCFPHKMAYMRAQMQSGRSVINVPRAFKRDQTDREVRDEIYAEARASGRSISRKK